MTEHVLGFRITGHKTSPFADAVEPVHGGALLDHRPRDPTMCYTYEREGPVTDAMMDQMRLEMEGCTQCRVKGVAIDNRGVMGKATS